jgi:hypothetical protein
MGSIIIASPPQQYHQLKISLVENNTAYTGNDVTGNWVVFRTQAISNAQADFPKITVVAHLELDVDAPAGRTSVNYARVEVGGVQVGQFATSPTANNGFGGGKFGNDLVVTLVAGTDYTRGTGFNLDFAQRCVIGGGAGGTGTANLLGYNVEAISD